MKIPFFKESLGTHATSKTSIAGTVIMGIAVYAFFDGRIEWPVMMETITAGFAILGISDRLGAND